MVGVGAAAEEESRRRLPSWMTGVRKYDNGEAFQSCNSKEISESNSNSVVKSETNRRIMARKKSTRQEEEEEEEEVVTEKKKYNGIGRKVRKKVKPKSDEIENDDGELTLTVEDLLSIAKEYVQADRDTVELQSSNRDYESEKKLPTSTSFGNDLRGSFNAPNDIQKLPTNSAVGFCNSTASLTRERRLFSANRTGDPAQDILDLFFGPLLKKPLEEETRTKFTITDIDFSNDSRKLNQNDVAGKNVPRMKMKSSLKDKVAMLLD